MAVDMKAAIDLLKNLSKEDLHTQLMRCCGSEKWCRSMASMLPVVTSFKELRDGADDIWWSLAPEEWHVAFLAHPRIGDKSALAKKMASNSKSWEGDEQKSAVGEKLELLVEKNVDYEKRFGHIFLICATGKTAEEMIEALERRMENSDIVEVGRLCIFIVEVFL